MRARILSVLIPLILAAGACGGGDAPAEDATTDPVSDGTEQADASADPPAVLSFDEVAVRSTEVATARFESRLIVTGHDETDPEAVAEVTSAGVFDNAVSARHMTIDVSSFASIATANPNSSLPPAFSGFLDDPLEVVAIGDEGWLSWPPLTMLTGQEGLWFSFEADSFDQTTEVFGFSGGVVDPTSLLSTLGLLEADLELVGTETVRGTETHHFRAEVDLLTLAGTLSAEEQAQLVLHFGSLSVADFPIEIWVGVDDGRLHRYHAVLPSEPPDAVVAVEAARVELHLDLFDYGVEAGITPPDAEQVMSGDLFLPSS